MSPDRPTPPTRRAVLAAGLAMLCGGARAETPLSLLVLLGDDTDRSTQISAAYKKACDFAVRRSYTVASPTESGSFILENIDGQPPSLVFAVGAMAARVGLREFPSSPVVYADALEGDVKPGTNAFGLTLDLDPRATVERLCALDPRWRSIGILEKSAEDTRRITEAAAAVGATVVAERAASDADIPGAIGRLAKGVDLLWLRDAPRLWTRESLEGAFAVAAKQHTALVGFHRSHFELPRPPAVIVCAHPATVADLAAKTTRALLLGDAIPALDGAPPMLVGSARAMRTLGPDATPLFDEVIG